MNTVSILIPTHNRKNTIIRAIDSVVSQEYDGIIECIIVDSSTNFDIQNLIENYIMSLKNNSRIIKYYRNDNNEFPYSNWIKLSTLFSGDYVKFLCDDDWLEHNSVSKLVNEIALNGYSCVISNINIHKDSIILKNYYDLKEPLTKDLIINSIIGIGTKFPITQSASLFTAVKFSEAFEFSLRNNSCTKLLFGEDLLFNYYFLFKDNTLGYLNQSLCNSGATDNSLTKITPKILIDFCNVNSLIVLAKFFGIKLSRYQKKIMRHTIFMYYLVNSFTSHKMPKLRNESKYLPIPNFIELKRFLLSEVKKRLWKSNT